MSNISLKTYSVLDEELQAIYFLILILKIPPLNKHKKTENRYALEEVQELLASSYPAFHHHYHLDHYCNNNTENPQPNFHKQATFTIGKFHSFLLDTVLERAISVKAIRLFNDGNDG